jgi:hypothetical protein
VFGYGHSNDFLPMLKPTSNPPPSIRISRANVSKTLLNSLKSSKRIYSFLFSNKSDQDIMIFFEFPPTPKKNPISRLN